jgi:hypothetical protein
MKDQEPAESEPPSALISYSHDSDDHKEWVRILGKRLMEDYGVDVILDEWEIGGGDNANLFMNRSLKSAVRVVMVCTEEYVRKADGGIGGAGYEANVMNAEVVKDQGGRRFIPVIRQSGENAAMPTFMAGRIYFDFSDDSLFDETVEKLAREIHDARPFKKPEIGRNPFLTESEEAPNSEAPFDEGDFVSDPLTVYKKALTLANTGDFTGWRDLVHAQKVFAEAELLRWKKEKQIEFPRERSALIDYFRPAVEIYGGLFAAAVAGIDSEDPRFHNQLSLIDWIRKPQGWEQSGNTIWVDLPDLVLFTYQAVLGAAAMSRHRPEMAYRLATTPLENPHNQKESKVLFKSRWAMGWPSSLDTHCTIAWSFLSSLPSAWPWLTKLLRSEEEAQASIGAYYLFLNSVDFVSAVKSAKRDGSPIREPIVPLGVVTLPRKVKARAKSIIAESANFLAELFVENGIASDELPQWWENWIQVCLKWIGEVYRDPIFRHIELPHATLPRMISGGTTSLQID